MPFAPPNFTSPSAQGGEGGGVDLESLGSDALALGLSALEVPIEILSRPSYAVSEALGAGRAGGGPLDVAGAAWRGVSGGPRKYPSVGQQISPKDPLGSIALDLLADPLMFFPAARATRGAVKLIKGTRIGEEIGAAAKGFGKFLRERQELQRASQLFLPLRSQVSFFGGRGGRLIPLKAEKAILEQSHEVARAERGALQEAERLGLSAPEAGPIRETVADYIESGGKTPVDPKAEEFAKFFQKEFADARELVENVEMRPGVRVPGKPKAGFGPLKKPEKLFPEFVAEENYFPQMLKQEIVDALEKGDLGELQKVAASLDVPLEIVQKFERSPSAAIDNLAKMLKTSKENAESIWRFNTGRPMRAGHIEFPRQGLIPTFLRERDPLKVYPKYMNQLHRRIAYAKEFGKDFEVLDDLLEESKRAGLLPEIAEKVRQAIRDPIAPEGTLLSKDFARKLMNGMVLTKMGPTSTIANASQPINSIIVDGGTNFLRGLFATRDPHRRAEAVVAFHYALKGHLEESIGMALEKPIIDLPILRRITGEKYLKRIGFTPVEQVNRILSASSGMTTAERLAKQAIDVGRELPTRELVRRGVSREEFRFFKRFGEFSERGRERIGLVAANRTQHVTNYLEIPLGWRSPEARIFTQYKSFIYQQSKFIHREIMKPAVKWFATDGKEGSLAPLLRASVAFNVGGQAVAGLRDLIRGTDKRKFDRNHPLSTLLKDASYVGAFGMASDIVDSALRGKLGDYLLGPTISEATDVAESLARFANQPEIPSPEEAAKQVYRRVGRGPLPFLQRYFE